MRLHEYLSLILDWFAIQYGCSREEAESDFLRKVCHPHVFARTKIENGKRVTYYRNISELSIIETSSAIKRFKAYATTHAGVIIPDMEDMEFMLHIKEEVERNKNFLYGKEK